MYLLKKNDLWKVKSSRTDTFHQTTTTSLHTIKPNNKIVRIFLQHLYISTLNLVLTFPF